MNENWSLSLGAKITQLLPFHLNKQLCTPLHNQPNELAKLLIIRQFVSIVVIKFPPFTLNVIAHLCNLLSEIRRNPLSNQDVS